MNILHLNEHLAWRGGIETYLLSLIPRLEELGHDQIAVFAKGRPELVPSSYCLPLLASARKRDERDVHQRLTEILLREEPDLVHVHNIHNLGAMRACLEHVPTILTAHDYRYVCPASNFYYRRSEQICERTCGPGCFLKTITKHCLSPRPHIASRYYRRVRVVAQHLHRFARVIAPSRYARDRFLRAGCSAAQTAVLPYFCPIEPFPAPPEPPTQPTATFMGRLNASKGYRYFIRALGRLSRSVRGILIGNLTPERTLEIRRLAEKAGCADRLELRPWAKREEIVSIMRESSVFVFPSLWGETLGIAGLEALACGVPVVASDVGGVREWLHPGVTGLLVPPKDERALAAAIQQIIDSPSRAQQIGRHGLDLIRQRFSPAGHVHELLNIYRVAAEAGASNQGSLQPAADIRLSASGLCEGAGSNDAGVSHTRANRELQHRTLDQ